MIFFFSLLLLSILVNASSEIIVDPRYLRQEGSAQKPILYTFVDTDNRDFDEELLELWKMYWGKAGWETQVLTPEVSKKHPDYEEYDKRLKDADVCCVPRLTYLRHIAMSVIKSGGYFSDYYVMPLQRAYANANDFMTLPNGGKFSSHDGVISFLSGSYEEWNRMLKLIMNNIEKNDFLTLRKIRHMDPDAYEMKDLVNAPYVILNNAQYELDICGDFSKEKLGIRFHSSELNHLDYNVTDRVGIVKSWMRLHEARCLSNRPVVFTFYEPVEYLQHQNPEGLLETWKNVWRNAGFEPVILSVDDVMRHPRYKYMLPMLNGVQFKDGRDKFNFLCFVRWVAMSNSGGGWMTDYDTFPLNIKPSFVLPNNGNFTLHAGLLPALMSGTALEWDRMAKIIFTLYRHKMVKEPGKISSWSDYLSLKQIHSSDQSSFLVKYETRDLYDFYINDIKAQEEGKQIPNVFDLKDKCHLSNDNEYLAIHFMHYRFENFYVRETKLDRTDFLRKWHQTWVEQCHHI